MSRERLCGNSCIKYIFNSYNIEDSSILNKDMTWITELALALVKYKFDIEVFCYKSSLFNDYKKLSKEDNEFLGFKYIRELEEKNIKIQEKELTKQELVNELEYSNYIILCVESKKFNNDNNMTGGHYIILKNMIGEKIEIVNPIKEKYETRIIRLEDIIYFCNTYGSWRIVIKENNND